MKTKFANIFNTMENRNGALILLVVILMVGVGSGLAACTPNPPDETQSSWTDHLYQYQNTSVEDNSKVVAIVDLLPVGDLLIRDQVALETHDTPYGLGVSYKTEDRALVRENLSQYNLALMHNAAIMFALIENMDSLSITIQDQYNRTDLYEDRFWGMYITLENLNEHFGTDYFTRENLALAVATKETFGELVDQVMVMKPQYIADSGIYQEINHVIGTGWEIMPNSGIGATFVLEENVVVDEFDLAAAAEENDIDITEYYGQEIEMYALDIINYAGSEPDTFYAFFICEDKLIAYKNFETAENARELEFYCYQIAQGQGY